MSIEDIVATMIEQVLSHAHHITEEMEDLRYGVPHLLTALTIAQDILDRDPSEHSLSELAEVYRCMSVALMLERDEEPCIEDLLVADIYFAGHRIIRCGLVELEKASLQLEEES